MKFRKPYMLLALASMLVGLSGCQTIASPRNCEAALHGLSAASEIARVLIQFGYAPEAAAKAAEAIAALQLATATACAYANPPVVVIG